MKSKKQIKNILIVDDSATARMIIKQCLQIIGFQEQIYLEAKNGLEALVILNSSQVEMLVTDLNMPVMDGRELLEKIKAVPHLENIFVIVITSSSNDAKENELRNLGATAVINKPISPANLLSALEVCD